MAEKRPYESYESKWQEHWEKEGTYRTSDSGGEKFYGLIEFPYPSGEGIHMGHPRPYVAIDVITRKRRMEGKNVLYPIGWDAFGLPTENYAIKNKIRPEEATRRNIANFTRQIRRLGIGFDWSREVNTTDPAYYRWTQWMFLKFLKSTFDEASGTAKLVTNPEAPIAPGDRSRMAYKARASINWCPSCKIGLANEEAQGGVCERCGGPVEKREKSQWMIAITKYAERLINDLDTVDYLERIKAQQKHWIGKSEGAYIDFAVSNGTPIRVFTTRPDTLFGATYLVLAPEHAQVAQWIHDGTVTNAREVNAYREAAAKKSDMERGAEGKDKTGVCLEGITATNPATKEAIPVWVADYVLAGYGTGAIMAVPAHDERDFAFAKTFNLPVRNVIDPVAVRDDVKGTAEFTSKKKVVAIVEDGKGNVLTIHWPPELGGRFFLGGTIEEGESPEQAALRELAEETGYTDATIVAVGEETFDFKYYAFSKKKAFQAFTRFVHIRLNSLRKEDQKLEQDEIGKFVVEWMPTKEVLNEVREELHVYGFRKFILGECYSGTGIVARSGSFSGLSQEEAARKIAESVGGTFTSQYKLRDWVFSRQRYWGEPIPVIHCAKCGTVPVPEDQLPVLLPDVKSYEPTDTGESPLSKIREWVEVKCPACGGDAERETDTMPNWAGSSWYFLRYCDPKNDKEFASAASLKKWMPVDLYEGGMEHTTLHLLYSRFWHKFLWDIRVVPKEIGPEPYRVRRSHGLVLAADGEKMSKSKGNGVNPDEVVDAYGADVLRAYQMFMGPFEQHVPWSSDGLEGVRRFLDKVWRLFKEGKPGVESGELETLYHQTIKKVGDDIESLGFNTAVSQLMILTNAYTDAGGVPAERQEGVLQILAPFAPHLTEELWSQRGNAESIHRSGWPAYDPSKTTAATFELVVQVNGKVRDKVTVPSDISEEDAIARALACENVKKHLGDTKPSLVKYVKGRLVAISL